MDAFTAADIDGGYANVTPSLCIGKPPYKAVLTFDPLMAAHMIEQGHTVCVMDSTIAYDTLRLLGLTEDKADYRLRLARFGPLRAG